MKYVYWLCSLNDKSIAWRWFISFVIIRNKTPSEYVYYGLHLYFSGLSLRKASERLSIVVKRNHVTIWNWIQKFQPKKIFSKSKSISEFIVDETLFKVGPDYVWLWWVAIEPTNRQILALSISKERNMFVAERFIANLVKNHGKHPVSTDGGTWYPPACKFLKLKHHTHSSFEKSIIERTMQYIKDRIENFDDYFPCRIKNCKLKHVINWLNLFIEYHNKEITTLKWTEPNFLYHNDIYYNDLLHIDFEYLLFCKTS